MPPGPPPKREAERRRRNKDGVEVEHVNVAELVAQDIEIPVSDPNWHPIAASWYDSLQRSGQAIFYEPSDWWTAYMLADVLDRWLKPQDVRVGEDRPGQQVGGEVTYLFEQKVIPMPGATLTALLKGMSSLMVTEGDRRRLKIELERAKAKAAILEGGSNVVSIVQSRDELWQR